jgi:hypothetical protein
MYALTEEAGENISVVAVLPVLQKNPSPLPLAVNCVVSPVQSVVLPVSVNVGSGVTVMLTAVRVLAAQVLS